ncbi:MAG: Zn-dependent exopeptidase M28 [Chloroflexi bacterium]|nr:Zn-dependent exopeptidase M28 [Chloroflexota bacterium]
MVRQMTDMPASSHQDYMFGLLKKVIDEIGPRPACSEAEKRLGRLLVEEWKPICDMIDVEPFTCSPTALDGSIPISAFLFLASVVLYWFLPPLALALAAASCGIVVLEVFRYKEFVDFLFPRKQGENVIGTIQPKGKPTQRVIVSGHLDSAYESNLFLYLKSASWPVIAVSVFGILVACAGSLAKTLAYLGVFSNDSALAGVGIAMIAFCPSAALFLFWTSWKPVPGAVDNLSGVSVVAGLGRCLGEARQSGEWFPERTQVVLLATSSEEPHLRGAMRYVGQHLKELRLMPTHCLVLEMIKDEKSLGVLKGESATGARHDPSLVKLAQEAAASHNWTIAAVQSQPPLGTDAAIFSLKGISATCLFSHDPDGFDPTYHTRYDTYEHVRPQALSVMLQLVMDMIRRIDES